VNFALKHPALLALMFESKHRADVPAELLALSDKAFSHARIVFAEGQSSGEVVAGDPVRLSLIVFAALLGLVSLATDGKFKGVSVDYLTGEFVERMILGFRPRR
jgi:hypothetical protein